MKSNMRVFVWVALALAPFSQAHYCIGDDSIRLPRYAGNANLVSAGHCPLLCLCQMGSYLAAPTINRVLTYGISSRARKSGKSNCHRGLCTNEDVALAFNWRRQDTPAGIGCPRPPVLDASSGKTLRSLESEGSGLPRRYPILGGKIEGKKAVTSSAATSILEPVDGKES